MPKRSRPRSARSRAEPARCPCLQDLRITASGDGLELVGSDLEITNRVQVPADVEETGVAVVPKMLGDIVRKLEPGPGDASRSPATRR